MQPIRTNLVLGMVVAVLSLGCDQTGVESASVMASRDLTPGGNLSTALTCSRCGVIVSDTDADELDDAWEMLHFGSLSRDGTADFEADGIPDRAEFQTGLAPIVDDAFEDADGDRFPNVFEYAKGTDPNDPVSSPAPDQLVDLARGADSTTDNLHDDLQDASRAAVAGMGAYQIIGLRAGTYLGARNCSLTVAPNGPYLLILGLDGAAATVLDAEGQPGQFFVQQRIVISSLTLANMRTSAPLYLTGAAVSGSRLVDLVVRGAFSPTFHGAILVSSHARNVEVVASTLFDNRGTAAGSTGSTGLHVKGHSELTLRNTILWNPALPSELVTDATSAVRAHFSLVRGDGITGSDNLVGVTSPGLRSDGRLLSTSTARGRGGPVVGSQRDMDLEPRPLTTPDVGADQFLDTDADDLADVFEFAHADSLTTLSMAAQDLDADGLTNAQEYALFTDPVSADSDGDGLDDSTEVAGGSNANDPDSDADGMRDGYEVEHGFAPTVDDSFEDADGDRFPNVFEYAKGTDANDAASRPVPDQLVDLARGADSTTDNIHNDLARAAHAAFAGTDAYQIIGLRAGTYLGAGNRTLIVAANRPYLLILGLDGAAATVLDAEGESGQFSVQQRIVISSLTLANMRTSAPIYLTGAAVSGSRLVGLIVRSASSPTFHGAIFVSGHARNVEVVASTLFDNRGTAAGSTGLYVKGNSELTLRNTILWNPALASELVTDATATVRAHFSLVRGDAITGSDNLVGVTSPGLRSDGRLSSTSTARGRGGPAVGPRLDMDLEPRPLATPDVGADQWTDTDHDALEDVWEGRYVGELHSLSARGDFDSDALADVDEYLLQTDPTLPDTDGDGATDGDELLFGLDPTILDAQNLDTDVNHDGVDDSLGLTLGIALSNFDVDRDGIPNTDEVAFGLDPLHGDSDGDGVPDRTDAFPLDRNLSALARIPGDTAAPVIELLQPFHAQLR